MTEKMLNRRLVEVANQLRKIPPSEWKKEPHKDLRDRSYSLELGNLKVEVGYSYPNYTLSVYEGGQQGSSVYFTSGEARTVSLWDYLSSRDAREIGRCAGIVERLFLQADVAQSEKYRTEMKRRLKLEEEGKDRKESRSLACLDKLEKLLSE